MLGMLLFGLHAFSQSKPITYYLPDISYNSAITTPESFFGFQIGDRHISHDQQMMYMQHIAAQSDRISIETYAHTYEGRPLLLLTITSSQNHQNIEDIRENHLATTQPGFTGEMDPELPVVLYQGYSIHGNEASGGNAAPLVAYYLAAGQSPEIEALLQKTIILFDPCYNPDGFHRFSTWVNMHRNEHMTPDPNDREYDESWPGSRTNHYWFDLNRDWLLQQHPESRGRINTFQRWRPHVLTDHHEMGTNSTFFFMPGEPQRVNPFTPKENQAMTGKIGDFHRQALDEIGSLYYSQEGYDDYYYGKGSTYPDAQGCIGILFEQASSRGHLQESANGVLSFPFTIRNQVKTALSTLEACKSLHNDLLSYQINFFQETMNVAAQDPTRGYIFAAPHDENRIQSFNDILLQHNITFHALAKDVKIGDQTYYANQAYIVPVEQSQYRLIKGIFEKITTFEDSLFYDVSAWTLPLAYNLDYDQVSKNVFANNLLGDQIEGAPKPMGQVVEDGEYAYLIPWDDYFAPTVANKILEAGLIAKVAHDAFMIRVKDEEMRFNPGTIMVAVKNNQTMEAAAIKALMKRLASQYGVMIYGVKTGFTKTGIDLGSRDFSTLEKPNVLLLVGEGVRSYDAGEVWHLLDQRYEIPVTKAPANTLNYIDLNRYHNIIMVDGRYNSISNRGVEKLRTWMSNGGNLILYKGAVSWATQNGLAQMKRKSIEGVEYPDNKRDYKHIGNDSGSRVVGGAIFNATIDRSHPIAYGYHQDQLPIFKRGTLFAEPTNNPYATPIRFSENPLLSGYIANNNLQALKGSAATIISGVGRGRSICFMHNTNFRAFWWGTHKLLANAIFFGKTIDGRGVEYARGE